MKYDLSMPLCGDIDIENLSISVLQKHLTHGNFTAQDLAACYLERIRRLNGLLRAVIEVNPDAINIAKRLDDERASGKTRGPLHGIPFLVKDNIATGDSLQTTAGSSALLGCKVAKDAAVVSQLRDAGAILLGHANLSEWASMRSSYYSEGYSSRGGQCRNPYNLAEHPGGSSCGSAVAVAVSMCSFSLGTETDGSVIFPADRNGVVGMKPTVGLISCDGVIPESRHLDVVGTFGKTVADVAVSLDALHHYEDGEDAPRLTSFVSDQSVLNGARFGLPWKRVWEAAAGSSGSSQQYGRLMDVIRLLEISGAKIEANADFPSAEDIIPPGGWDWDYPSSQGRPDQSEFTVVKTDFCNDIKSYLSTLVETPSGIRDLDDIIAYNRRHADHEGGIPGKHGAWPTGQDTFEQSADSRGIEDDTYRRALSFIRQKSREEGIDAALANNGLKLDGLLVPIQAEGGVACQVAAKAGYPVITIPIGEDDNGVPFGLGIIQTGECDHLLIKYGSAIEDLVPKRPVPRFRNIDARNWMYVGIKPTG